MSSADYWEDYEVVTIETPELVTLTLPLAGFGPRMLALIIDSVIQAVVSMLLLLIVVFAASTITSFLQSPDSFVFVMIGLLLASLLLFTGYFVIFEWLWNGQTPGKRIVGIRVVKRGGLPLQLTDVLLRNLLRIVDTLPTNYFAGMVSFFCTGSQQRIGDLVADTIVVREFASTLPYTWAGSPGTSSTAQTPAGVTLDNRTIYLISSLLARRHELEDAQRFSLAGRIIQSIGYDPGPLTLDQRESYLGSLVYGPGT